MNILRSHIAGLVVAPAFGARLFTAFFFIAPIRGLKVMHGPAELLVIKRGGTQTIPGMHALRNHPAMTGSGINRGPPGRFDSTG